MGQNHEYMDTGALTEDAVPEPTEQGPVEAPGSPAKIQQSSPPTPESPATP